MKKMILVFVLSIYLLLFILIKPALADLQGSLIFETHCAGCHPQGGNIIRRGKNLSKKALQKNQMDSLEAVTNIVTMGKNNMSAFGARLSPEEIAEVAKYVLEQAENNWHN